MNFPTPPDDSGSRRLLDAVGNRLEEALRTVEDQLRFRHGLLVSPLHWKTLRHEVSALRRQIAGDRPTHLARDVIGDPGHPELADTPVPHGDPTGILVANVARAREGARSFEEELRNIDPALARVAETIRYRVYDLESSTLGFLHRRARLDKAQLYVLVTTALSNGTPEEVTAAALRGGADVIQLREKTMEGRSSLELARRLREITAAAGALLIINDRVEEAVLSGADGVHLGQGDIRPAEARRILGPDALIGLSTHRVEEAARAADDGADYIGIGPIFETKTKEHRRSVGLDYIRQATAATDLPGFAIGSVNRQTIDSVILAGATRVAICTGVIASENVEGQTRDFREKLDRAAEAAADRHPVERAE